MARDLDETLLETVRVRRRRLRDAFLQGTLRSRRVIPDNVRQLVIGIVLAGIACAACVGVSFFRTHYTLSLHDALPIYRKSVV